MNQEFSLEAFDELLSEAPRRRRRGMRSRTASAKRLAALRRAAFRRRFGRPFPGPRNRFRPRFPFRPVFPVPPRWPPGWQPPTDSPPIGGSAGGGKSFGSASPSSSTLPIEDPDMGVVDPDAAQGLSAPPTSEPDGDDGGEPNEPTASADGAEFLPEFGWPGEFGFEVYEFGESEVGKDPALMALAERIMARRPVRRSAMEFEGGKRKKRRRTLTDCFGAIDIERVRTTYHDNNAASAAKEVDRCSCIVMLNVALGQLLRLKTKNNRARGKSTRIVKMGNLTTETIEQAMAQLVRARLAKPATKIDFFDERNKTAGTLKPVRLKESVQKAVLALAPKEGCWYAFGLSVMDGYHSVLLLVDKTGTEGKIYWLDQFSAGINDDVTTTLDDRITTKTQTFWQIVKDEKKIGSNTMVRIWPLRRWTP